MKYLICTLFILLTLNLKAERALPFLENSRFSTDLSIRSSYNDRVEEVSFQEFLGFDFQKFINCKGRDLGSIILQPYIYRIDNGISTPPYYDDSHDWELVFRTLTFTFTGLGSQNPWIKLGHFELPFGLDHRKDTNGKLHQYSIVKATGLKIDWGVSLGQEFENWYYEAAITRGSGVKYRDSNNPYAFTARLAYDFEIWTLGASIFSGEVLKDNSTVKNEIIALDFEIYLKSLGILCEFYTGRQNNNGINGGLFELNWTSFDQSFKTYSQFHIQDKSHISTKSSIILGSEYQINRKLSITAQIDFAVSSPYKRQNVFEIQFRYKF